MTLIARARPGGNAEDFELSITPAGLAMLSPFIALGTGCVAGNPGVDLDNAGDEAEG